MGGSGDASRAVIQPAGLGFRFTHHIGQRADGHAIGRHQHIWHAAHQPDCGQIFWLEGHTGAENGEIDRPRADGGQQQRMPIGFSPRHEFAANIARSAGAVIHHHLLAEPGRKTFSREPPDQIRGPGGGEGDNQANGAVGQPLRQGGQRQAGPNGQGAQAATGNHGF